MSDLLSQDEIDALLNGISSDTSAPAEPETNSMPISEEPIEGEVSLSRQEIDVLGEIGNISMGTSATALSEILNNIVTITTPKVEIMDWEEIIKQYPKPFVVTEVKYTEGLLGSNLLIMRTEDVKVLTNLMMNEDPHKEREIEALELSAIGEAMNQMVGASCTSLSSMILKKIDITPPNASYIDFSSTDRESLKIDFTKEKIVKVAFSMVVGDLLDSELMQLIPISFAKQLVKSMLIAQGTYVEDEMEAATDSVEPPIMDKEMSVPEPPKNEQKNTPPQKRADQSQQHIEPPASHTMQQEHQMRTPVNVQPAQFQSLEDPQFSGYKENIGLIMDVPLQVTVELGRATRMIREILEFGPGSIVELDKLAGEPVDILVNGKIIAKGEVVVIDESFGVRITDIIHPSKRI